MLLCDPEQSDSQSPHKIRRRDVAKCIKCEVHWLRSSWEIHENSGVCTQCQFQLWSDNYLFCENKCSSASAVLGTVITGWCQAQDSGYSRICQVLYCHCWLWLVTNRRWWRDTALVLQLRRTFRFGELRNCTESVYLHSEVYSIHIIVTGGHKNVIGNT